ncbi:MAG: glycosyltransferase [Deltaproteobacteria bacterium]|nr:glycosyltransferase [Deltaproteobacteria bacterium]
MIDTLECGGTQKQLLLIAQAIGGRGLSPYTLIVFREPLTMIDDFRSAGVNVIQVDKKSEIDPGFFLRLYRFLRKTRPKIVTTFLPTADMWGRLAAKLAGVPVIGCSIRSLPQKQGAVRDLFMKSMHGISDFIVCNSHSAARRLSELGLCVETKTRVIHNGVRITGDSAAAKNDGHKTVGIVARLVAVKDIGTLIRAFAGLPPGLQERLVIVGDGPCRAELERAAAELGVAEKVRFMGECREVQGVVESFSVGVLTSRYEGLSNVILEYMAAGIPVVATDTGGTPELVVEGENGFMFRPGDEKTLTEKLKLLLADPGMAQTMGEKGFDKVSREFSIPHMTESWNGLIDGYLQASH